MGGADGSIYDFDVNSGAVHCRRRRSRRLLGQAAMVLFGPIRIYAPTRLLVGIEKPQPDPRIRRSASAMIRSINSFTVGMFVDQPTTMPQLTAHASNIAVDHDFSDDACDHIVDGAILRAGALLTLDLEPPLHGGNCRARAPGWCFAAPA